MDFFMFHRPRSYVAMTIVGDNNSATEICKVDGRFQLGYSQATMSGIEYQYYTTILCDGLEMQYRAGGYHTSVYNYRMVTRTFRP